jgi:hypothetical protein
VSGRVTLDGKPLAGATVLFQPVAAEGSMSAPAPGSSGKTDADGRYTLMASTGEHGAWVGKHRVMIDGYTADAGSSDARPRGGPPLKNVVPKDWNSTGPGQTYEVPPAGTPDANFDIETKKP